MLGNVYLDKLDKELEGCGLCFVRYAEDCNIFVRSEMVANRVVASVSSWLERKLRLKANAMITNKAANSSMACIAEAEWM